MQHSPCVPSGQSHADTAAANRNAANVLVKSMVFEMVCGGVCARASGWCRLVLMQHLQSGCAFTINVLKGSQRRHARGQHDICCGTYFCSSKILWSASIEPQLLQKGVWSNTRVSATNGGSASEISHQLLHSSKLKIL